MKALALISGGLDSELAAKLILDQGIEVTGIHFSHTFSTPLGYKYKPNIEKVAAELGIPLRIYDINREIQEIVKHPRHGYGSGLNPCIDCRILIFAKAKKLLVELSARFVVSGEVLGQRPMSQNKQSLGIIDNESGLGGLIVRPLCARLLPPAIPETSGWLDRTKLLSLQGRTRKPQLELAAKYKFRAYSTPAGGCLLTDPGFSRRIKESRLHGEDSAVDIELLKLGRHFRLKDKIKCLLGRNQKENDLLTEMAGENDILIEPVNVPGPTALLKNCAINNDKDYIDLAARLCVSYSKTDKPVIVRYGRIRGNKPEWQNELTITVPQHRENLQSAVALI